MANELKLDNLDLFPYNSEQKINIFKSYPQNNNFSSRFPKKNFMKKYSNYGNKQFLKNKRKDKKRNKNDIPETPHNTGQYLSHIHQEFEPKRKSSQIEKENENDESENYINGFEDDNEDDFDEIGNLDYDFVNDKKRERLMSLEGKDLQDFLFKPNETGENNIVKTSLDFNEKNEDFDLNLQPSNSSKL